MYDSLSEQEHASTLSKEGADITQLLLCRKRQMGLLKGAFSFQTAIAIMKCCFCRFFLVLSRLIVILSTDVRLGVKKWGFYFSLKKRYSSFNDYDEISGMVVCLCCVLVICQDMKMKLRVNHLGIIQGR